MVIKERCIDTVDIQFGVCQKWKSYTIEVLLTFFAITKQSNLFLLDRHQTVCVENNLSAMRFYFSYLKIKIRTALCVK